MHYIVFNSRYKFNKDLYWSRKFLKTLFDNQLCFDFMMTEKGRQFLRWSAPIYVHAHDGQGVREINKHLAAYVFSLPHSHFDLDKVTLGIELSFASPDCSHLQIFCREGQAHYSWTITLAISVFLTLRPLLVDPAT